MSHDPRPDTVPPTGPIHHPDGHVGGPRPYALIGWVVVPALALLGLIGYLLFSGGGRDKGPRDRGAAAPTEQPLAGARSALAKRTDLGSCRGALQQFNAHLAEHPAPAPGDLAARLRPLVTLDEGELAEVLSPTFTPLDAYHLDACFLLRDVAGSLTVTPAAAQAGTAPARQAPLDQAAAAFGWVVRQVRLRDADEPLPPAHVLRRGWGTVLDRATTFLALLEQFGQDEEGASGLQGCLLILPSPEGERLWACGVAVGDRPEALYLFDPRIGLPIPGPGGKGIATLAQARTDPAVLAQLADGKAPYDVTAEQARGAQIRLCVPLSALAPRMAHAQGVLLRESVLGDQPLPPPVRVRLAEEPGRALALVGAAVKASGGDSTAVGLWQPGVGLLRRFLPPDEGGSDVGKPFLVRQLNGFSLPDDRAAGVLTRQRIYQLEMVPWEDFPARFRDPGRFRWDMGLGQRLRSRFALPFWKLAGETDSPRELTLRGQFLQAFPQLVREQSNWKQWQQRRAWAADLEPRVDEWVERALAAYAAELRAQGVEEKTMARQQVEQVWKQSEPVEVLLTGAMAESVGAEMTFLLGLCTYERAERMRLRTEQAARGRAVSQAERDGLQEAWERSRDWWRQFEDGYPRSPSRPAARRLHAEVLSHLGDRAGAAKWYTSAGAPAMEQLGNAYRARQNAP